MKYSNGLTAKEARGLDSYFVQIVDVGKAIMTTSRALATYGLKIKKNIHGVEFGFKLDDYYSPWFMANPKEIAQLLKITKSKKIVDLENKTIEVMMTKNLNCRGIRL